MLEETVRSTVQYSVKHQLLRRTSPRGSSKQFRNRAGVLSSEDGAELVRTQDREGDPLHTELALSRGLLVYARMEASYPMLDKLFTVSMRLAHEIIN